MTEFYAPKDIRFIRKHCLWLLHNLSTLRNEQRWPHQETGYIDQPGGHSHSQRAPFLTPVEYAAEITTRLEKCGIDGLILLAIECWGESPDTLARYLGMMPITIKRKGKSALRYIASGPVRRWINSRKRLAESYHDFKRRI